MKELIAVFDFGSQYSQLIARRIREMGVYCEIVRHNISKDELLRLDPLAVVLSGGPASVLDPDHPSIDREILSLDMPVLGICYGMQLMAQMLGGVVEKGRSGEYGPSSIEIVSSTGIFRGMESPLDVWMSHGDHVAAVPEGFHVQAITHDCPIASMEDGGGKRYGIQFHPEVVHTPKGIDIIRNFIFHMAGCTGDWTMGRFAEESVEKIKDTVGDSNVICGLSGGVDSTVAAALINRAIGNQMKAIFVDNGLLRKGEVDEIRTLFTEDYKLDIRIVDARARFLDALRGVIDPEKKRKIIGETFIDVFRDEAERIESARFLAQGTLYPDVVESQSAHGGPSSMIKSHHNVGGLPEDLDFELLEPLRELFKDEVRKLGRELGLPESLLMRQPFPGPGLAVRIIGEVTEEILAVLRDADVIVQEEMREYKGYGDIWQSFAVLLPVKSVGVMGDERTYANVVALRIVASLDAMTADWVKLPYEILGKISSRIINEVRGVNRVVYDISSKPPSTIEWE
ncbi:MAG: glutamine-hydrolyzing GMP synthase [Thermodesulfobacteriota bacterium]|nr:glutamine-hydrolyzing GMP synthase [Thermodesulfobacteriota bacterium]